MKHIDFSIQDLIRESVYISYCTKGGFNYETLRNMYFDEYELVLKETRMLVEKIKEVAKDG